MAEDLKLASLQTAISTSAAILDHTTETPLIILLG